MRKNKFVKRKQQSMKNTIILLILILGLGYAALQSNLNISGLANMGNPTWNIHWENVQVKEGSVSASTPTIDSAKTTVTYSVVLNIPGDYYEFTVDAVNSGTIDGMIESITSKLNGATITNLPDYLRYTVTYSDGVPLAVNQLLAAGTTETYKVRIKYRDDIELNQIPATNQTLNLQFTVKYRQATNSATVIDHSFANQSWETIINNVRSGNTDNYNVGDTKTVDMESLGTYILRIANKSTPSECSTTEFSQTACGFVLEFVSVLSNQFMNSNNTNTGGWPSSEIRTYVNSDIYNAIPAELKEGIISTSVVSGHGSKDSANFVSIDKLYLLDAREIYGTSFTETWNTANDYERQLDYYSNLGVTTTSNTLVPKRKVNNNDNWWLRSAYSATTNTFYVVLTNGNYSRHRSDYANGVSPAFRIG